MHPNPELAEALADLLGELVEGVPDHFAFVLNRGDAGLLASLQRLSPEAASARHDGGSSIAAHVEHLRYGLSLMNRWAGGENNPFADADWSASWKKTEVTEDEWRTLQAALRRETTAWREALAHSREVDGVELRGMIGSIVHLAYHLGAMRQMDRRLSGPPAND